MLNNKNLVNISKFYNVYAQSTSNGSFSVNPQNKILKGTIVTINCYPNNYYQVSTVTVTRSKGGTVSISGSGNTRTFIMPNDDVTVSVSFSQVEINSREVLIKNSSKYNILVEVRGSIRGTVHLSFSLNSGQQVSKILYKNWSSNNTALWIVAWRSDNSSDWYLSGNWYRNGGENAYGSTGTDSGKYVTTCSQSLDNIFCPEGSTCEFTTKK